jgi:hypothetical protein
LAASKFAAGPKSSKLSVEIDKFEMTSDKSVSNLSISTESFEDLGPAANLDAANQNQSVEANRYKKSYPLSFAS